MAILINMSETKTGVKDKNLSWKAKGIHTYLSNTKPSQNFVLHNLFEESKDNKASVYAGITELKNQEYLHVFPLNPNKASKYIYLVFGEPTSFSKRQELAFSKQFIEKTGLIIRKNGQGDKRLLVKNILKSILQSVCSCSSCCNSTRSVLLSRIPTPAQSILNREVEQLLEYWLENIRKHIKDSKVYNLGRKRLVRKYIFLRNKYNRKMVLKKRGQPSEAYQEIREAMELYLELLDNTRTLLLRRTFPWHVGLDEFFGFGSYSENMLFKNLKGKARSVKDIGSWFSECCKGREYCFKIYTKAAKTVNQEVFKELEKYMVRRDKNFARSDYGALVTACDRYCTFFEKNKRQLRTPNVYDSEYPLRFLKYFLKFIDSRFESRRFNGYAMLNKRFLDNEFKAYLIEMGWMSKR